MALPQLTPEQRADALEKAAAARRERAAVKNRLKNSQGSFADVVKEGKTNDVIGKMKVSSLLESMPGVGRVRARQIMEEIGHLRDAARARARREPDRGAARAFQAGLSPDRGAGWGPSGPARLAASRGPGRSDGRRQGDGRSLGSRAPPARSGISVSATTRRPRPGEIDGRHYHFVSDERVRRDGRGRRAARMGRRAQPARYGTPRAPVEAALAAGHPVLLEIDLQGARQVRETMPEALFVFLAPPTWEALVDGSSGGAPRPSPNGGRGWRPRGWR